jgi:hypothetical protein
MAGPSVTTAPSPAPAPTRSAPPPPTQPPAGTAPNGWHTRADEGWRAASAAQHPPSAGSTRSGLPKRAPQAQLVPGGVAAKPTKVNRPSAEELRGLLSSYQRGVQRGRQAGGSDPSRTQATEGNR